MITIKYRESLEYGNRRRKFLDEDRAMEFALLTGRTTLKDSDISVLSEWGVEFERVPNE